MSGVTDVEVSRALNALITTLNDQHARAVSIDRLQAIVTGTLGGQRSILAQPESSGGPSAQLTDPAGEQLGRIWLEGGRWQSCRTGAPLSGAYIP